MTEEQLSKKQQRLAREAQALRANLQRRKAQDRLRQESGPDGETSDPQTKPDGSESD